jgi:ribonuclease III
MKRVRKTSVLPVAGAEPADARTRDWAAQLLGHDFRNPALLQEALSHTSAGKLNYQRLEFLGDRVLGCVMADWLLAQYPAEPEGKLALRFAELVRKETCAHVAREVEAAEYIRVERAAAHARVHHTDNVLGDVCEALIGALYLDGGMDVATAFIRSGWKKLIVADSIAPKDIKSALQEWAQARGLPLPDYALVKRLGPDHAPQFEVQVSVQGFDTALATGTSKQEAEKKAAQTLLERLKKS